MELTNKELRIIRSALTDTLDVLGLEKEDMDNVAESLEVAVKIYEEDILALIEKISIRLGGI